MEGIYGLEDQSLPITAFIDNKSVIEALQSTKLVGDKRLRIDIASIVEMKLNNRVEIKWCPGKIQLASKGICVICCVGKGHNNPLTGG